MLVEAVQRGIASGALEAGTLLPESEQLIAHFQSLVVEALAATGVCPRRGLTPATRTPHRGQARCGGQCPLP